MGHLLAKLRGIVRWMWSTRFKRRIVVGVFILYGIYLFSPVIFIGEYLDGDKIQSKSRPSQILDRKGRLISELFSERYGSLTDEKLPEKMAAVLLYVEDRNFHYHWGIDPVAIVRAMARNIAAGGYSQGASTISQQLARIILNDRSKTLRRKVKEAFLALAIEGRLSKEEILAEYMNRVYLGHGAYGFQNAARFYFNKDVYKLTSFECILLASLPAAPNRYSPIKNINKSFGRVKLLVESAINSDADFLTAKDKKNIYKQMSRFYGTLNRSPTETVFGEFTGSNPTITEYVRNELVRKLGEDAVYSGGYKVYTTIDIDFQRAAEEQAETYIKAKRKSTPVRLVVPEDDDDKKKFYKKLAKLKTKRGLLKKKETIDLLSRLIGVPLPLYDIHNQSATGLAAGPNLSLQAAAIGIEIGTGNILFMKGGIGFSARNQFNRALMAYRQTGSAIKPTVYSAGIESGKIHSTTLLEDAPQFFESTLQDEKDWTPENIDFNYKGEVTVREALARSMNMPAVLAAKKTGMDNLRSQFRDMFFPRQADFERRFKPVLSIAIGSMEFSPAELASAYSAFAQNGKIYRPKIILKVADAHGKIIQGNWDRLFAGIPDVRTAMPADTAMVMNSLMAKSGRFSKAHVYYKKKYVGKTGTTNHYKDAWFIGITPHVAAAVWVGYDNHAYGMGGGGTGSAMAAPLWGKIMHQAYKGKKSGWYKFAEPKAVKKTVCRASGALAKASCPKKISDLFTKKHAPKGTCKLNHSADTLASGTFNDLDFD